jgi:hypothetical protein
MKKVRFSILLFASCFFAGQSIADGPFHDDGRGCSVFTIAKDGQVFFGGNDDYIEPDSYYWVDPGDGTHYGVIWIGRPDNVQQGVNEMGLAYDANGLPRVSVNPHNERQTVSGSYTSYPIHIMHECATVEEVIDWVKTHQWHSFMHDQMQFADATGDAVIISAGKDKEVVYTRKEKGDGFIISTNFNVANPVNGFGYPCWRYEMAEGMLTTLLNREQTIGVEDVRGVLDAIHQEGINSWTVGSILADLSNGIVYLYYFHQFDRPVLINVEDELDNPREAGPLSQLFPEEVQVEARKRFERLNSMGQRCQRIGMTWVLIVVLSLLLFLVVKGRSKHHFWFLAILLLGPLALTVWILAGRNQEQRPWRQTYIEVIGDILPLVAVLTAATVLLVRMPGLQASPALQFLIFYIAPLAVIWLIHGLSLYRLLNISLGRFLLNRLPHIIIVTNLGLAGIFAVAMSLVNQSVRFCAIMPLSPWTIATWWLVFVVGALLSAFLFLLFHEKRNIDEGSPAWSMISSGITESHMKTWHKLWWQVLLSFVILALGMFAGAFFQQAIS